MSQAELRLVRAHSLAIAKRGGGWLAMSGGVVWEGFAVSHNLAYIWESLSNLQFAKAAGYLHLPPLITIAIGVAWVVLAQRENRGADGVRFEPGSPELHLPEINDDGEYDYKLEHERRDGKVYEKTTLMVTRH